MSNIRKIMINEMSKSGGKIKYLHGGSMPNIEADIEFYKWLSYEPIFEKNEIDYLNSIKPENLTLEQLEELKRYRTNKVYAQLFYKYIFGNELTSEEYKIVCDFMFKNSIFKIIQYKLTKEEIEIAKEQAMKLFSEMTKNECQNYLESRNTRNHRKEFLNMSMIDAFVFHLISDMAIKRGTKDINSLIESQLESNGVMREKSYYNALYPYKRK